MIPEDTNQIDSKISSILSQHDCWDIGSGLNSLEWLVTYGNRKNPIGINIEDERLNAILEGGFPALKLNAFDIPKGIKTKAITMCHFLEHLPNPEACRRIIQYALQHATELVIISGPYFEDDEELRKHGFKFNWGAWDDHESKYSAKDVINVLKHEVGCNYSISVGFGATNTGEKNIFTVDDLDNQGDYSSHSNKSKPIINLIRPMFQEFMVCISPNGTVDTRILHERRHGRYGILQHELLRQFTSNHYYTNGLLHQLQG